jgi:hypothetical protein
MTPPASFSMQEYKALPDTERQHVGDVEQAASGANGVVFLDLRAVVDRHVPAAEVDHFGAEFAVGGIERSLLEHIEPVSIEITSRAACLRDAGQGAGSEVWLFQMSEPQHGHAPTGKRPSGLRPESASAVLQRLARGWPLPARCALHPSDSGLNAGHDFY